MNENKKNVSSVYIAFLLIPFFDPNIIGTLPSLSFLNGIVLVWQIIDIMIGLSYFIKNRHVREYKYTHVPYILIFSAIILLSTIKSDADTLRMFYYFLEIVAIFSIIYHIGIKRGNIKQVCCVMFYYYGFLLILNLITMIVYPNGQDQYWVMGNKNNIIYYGLPFLLYATGRCMHGEENTLIKILFPFALCIVSTIIGHSSTSTVAFIIIIIVFMVEHILPIKIRVRLDFIFIGALVMSAAFVFVSDLRILESAIAYFEKEESFGRFIVWEKSLDYISDNVFWGLGLESIDVMDDKFGYSHCHNKYLDILYLGGCIGLFSFLLALYKVLRSIDKYKNETIIIKLIVAILSAYAIEFLMEAKRADIAMYVVFFLAPFICNYSNRYKNGVLY